MRAVVKDDDLHLQTTKEFLDPPDSGEAHLIGIHFCQTGDSNLHAIVNDSELGAEGGQIYLAKRL